MKPDDSDAIRLRVFAEAVDAMRKVQKRHFSGERGLAPEARRLEAEVDRATEAILDRQGRMFDP